MPKKLRKILLVGLKLVIAGLLLWYVLSKVNWRDFRGTLLSAVQQRPWLLAASFLCFVAPMLMMSVRWWYLLRIQGIHIRLYESLRLTLLGSFFGYVVPGTVSGDLVKAWYVAKHTERKAAALVSVFVDRVVGLFEFAVLPAVVMLCLLAAGRFDAERFRLPAVVVAVVLGGVFFALGLLLSSRLRRWLHAGAIVRRLPMQQHVAVMAEAARIYRREWPSLLRALAITFGGQAFFISAIMLVGMSLALTVPWHLYFLYVPLICIMAAVPISPGGLGVAENLYVFFFVPAGPGASEVLALALLARLLPMIVSLPGLWVAMTGVRLPKAAQMQRELDET